MDDWQLQISPVVRLERPDTMFDFTYFDCFFYEWCSKQVATCDIKCDKKASLVLHTRQLKEDNGKTKT